MCFMHIVGNRRHVFGWGSKRGVHSLVQVPIGTQYIMVPNSISTAMPNGLMVEIYWQQDDEGALRISGQSEPIPATVPSLGANPL